MLGEIYLKKVVISGENYERADLDIEKLAPLSYYFMMHKHGILHACIAVERGNNQTYVFQSLKTPDFVLYNKFTAGETFSSLVDFYENEGYTYQGNLTWSELNELFTGEFVKK